MDFFNAIEKRYSHKERFLPDPVPLQDLEKIASAGLLAPTGMNSQCVTLVILRGRSEIDPLCDVVATDGLRTAPAVIALLVDRKKSRSLPNNYDFELEDYSAAATQMLLAAAALGYSSVWLDSPYFDENNEKAARKALGASDDYCLRVVLPIGLPDGEGSKRGKLPKEERLFYGKLAK